MPRYVVTHIREYAEKWLIEADSRFEAVGIGGEILDHDDGYAGDSTVDSWIEEVASDQDEL